MDGTLVMADNFNSPSLLQAASIPYFEGNVCLVTSKSGKRWVIPKGSISKGKTAAETALLEAWEEAGLTGKLNSNPLGSYRYSKSGLSYLVTVFLMQVSSVAEVYPEHRQRLRKWVSISEANALVHEKDLLDLLQSLPLDFALQDKSNSKAETSLGEVISR
jgi:8-oxo-dGTP pyrophosphatase MutT (NUDIX family)